MWLTDLEENPAYTTCPSPTKKVGQPETLAAVGSSQLSHLSHSKTSGAKLKAAIRPTRPTTEKHVGRLQSVAAVGPSDTSDKKKCI